MHHLNLFSKYFLFPFAEEFSSSFRLKSIIFQLTHARDEDESRLKKWQLKTTHVSRLLFQQFVCTNIIYEGNHRMSSRDSAPYDIFFCRNYIELKAISPRSLSNLFSPDTPENVNETFSSLTRARR